MSVENIRTLIVIIQGTLLAIQIATGIKWLCIPIILLGVVCVILQKHE